MHSLSLLLGAAAGVNAMLGSEIDAVVLPGNQFLCANDCVHQRVFFGTGAACPENEVVLLEDEEGKFSVPGFEPDFEPDFACRGEPVLSYPGNSQRERTADEALEQCDLKTLTDPNEIDCEFNRNIGDKPKIVQWADVEKLLEEAAAGERSSFTDQEKNFLESTVGKELLSEGFKKEDVKKLPKDRFGRPGIFGVDLTQFGI